MMNSLSRMNTSKLVVASFFLMIVFDIVREIPSFATNVARCIFVIIAAIEIINTKKLVANKFSLLFLLYFLCTFISLIYSPFFSIPILLATFQFCLINLIIILLPVDIRNKIKEYLIKYGVIFIALAVLYSLLLLAFGGYDNWGGRVYNYIGHEILGQITMGGQEKGYTSIFSNPNSFSLYLLIAITMLFSQFDIKNKKQILVLIILIAGVYITKSRAGYVACIIIICTSFFILIGRKIKWAPAVIFITGLLIAAFNFDAILEIISQIDLNGREGMWEKAIESIIQHPVVGTGISSGKKYIVTDEIVVFSSYIAVLTEVGIIGFAIFMLIITNVLYHSYKGVIEARHRTKKDAHNLLLCFLTTTVLGAIAFVENTLMNINVSHIIWLIFTCNVMCRNQSSINE